jgi:hypothetical protein
MSVVMTGTAALRQPVSYDHRHSDRPVACGLDQRLPMLAPRKRYPIEHSSFANPCLTITAILIDQ